LFILKIDLKKPIIIHIYKEEKLGEITEADLENPINNK
jgi:hypothetical protein